MTRLCNVDQIGETVKSLANLKIVCHISFDFYIVWVDCCGKTSNFINIWFVVRRCWKAFWRHVGHPKCQMKWNLQMKRDDMKSTWNTILSWYVPKANVDHTISGQGTAISTLDHLATTPRAWWWSNYMHRCRYIVRMLHIIAILLSISWTASLYGAYDDQVKPSLLVSSTFSPDDLSKIYNKKPLLQYSSI